MQAVESRKLKVGQRVYWEADAGDCGIVVEVGYSMVRIAWDTGHCKGQVGTIDHRDMQNVSTFAKTVQEGSR